MGWKKIHVEEYTFGNEDYFIWKNLEFEDILEEYCTYMERENERKHKEEENAKKITENLMVTDVLTDVEKDFFMEKTY